MVALTLYGGVGEIGGNKFLLEDSGTRILLDFGMSFGQRGLYFEEYLTPRPGNGLGDFLELGLIPDLKGIYRSDLLSVIGRKPEECGVQAVFISHAHADHVNYVSFLHEKIPLHCSETSLLILKALDEAKTRNIESEILNFKERPLLRKDCRKEPVQRKVKTFRSGEKIKLDNLEIVPLNVDHSIPGACGFIIHTSEGTILYTGDIRLHGTHGELTRGFLEKTSSKDIDYMLCEGTRIDQPSDGRTEERVFTECNEKTMKTGGMVVADFNFKDLTRVKTFLDVARKNGRKLMVHLSDAFLLKFLSQNPELNAPAPDDENILLYIPKKGSGTYADEDYTPEERQFLGLENTVKADEIKQDNAVFCSSFYKMKELIDIKPVSGSTFIYSLSEPFNEDMAVSFERLKNWVEHFKLDFFQSHCSGHAPSNDLREIVATANPKKLFAIHTEKPELFRKIVPEGAGVLIPKQGKEYKI